MTASEDLSLAMDLSGDITDFSITTRAQMDALLNAVSENPDSWMEDEDILGPMMSFQPRSNATRSGRAVRPAASLTSQIAHLWKAQNPAVIIEEPAESECTSASTEESLQTRATSADFDDDASIYSQDSGNLPYLARRSQARRPPLSNMFASTSSEPIRTAEPPVFSRARNSRKREGMVLQDHVDVENAPQTVSVSTFKGVSPVAEPDDDVFYSRNATTGYLRGKFMRTMPRAGYAYPSPEVDMGTLLDACAEIKQLDATVDQRMHKSTRSLGRIVKDTFASLASKTPRKPRKRPGLFGMNGRSSFDV